MKAWVTALLLTTSLTAQAAPDLDALLGEIRQTQKQQQQVNTERERRFVNNRNEQAELLRKARAELGVQEKRSQSLRGEFDALQKELTTLSSRLNEEAGDLNQLVAVVRQAAGDLQAVADDSIISAEFPARVGRLSELAAGDQIPTATELEDMWYLLQQEMTETGKVSRFEADVIGVEGNAESRPVARVGPFTAVVGADYLQYLPGAGLKVLARQPGAGVRAQAEAFHEAEQGLQRLAIDPTRGSVLELLVEKPGLIERVRQGGGVGAVIIGLGLLGVALALLQLVRLVITGARVRAQLKSLSDPRPGNPLGRVLQSAREANTEDAETLELMLDEAVLREVPRLQRGQGLVKLLAAVAPLLGLLGTVVGMIATFQAITLFGTGDPKLMAGGISQALVTTVLGLIAAIPLLFAHSLLVARSRGLIQVLDEQSAGLLARYLETPEAGRDQHG